MGAPQAGCGQGLRQKPHNGHRHLSLSFRSAGVAGAYLCGPRISRRAHPPQPNFAPLADPATPAEAAQSQKSRKIIPKDPQIIKMQV